MDTWQITQDGTFIYELGPKGSNKWWAHVQTAGHERVSHEEVQKVARLMHSAPSLLEALEDMVDAMQSYGYNFSPEISTAKAAIAKAHGAEAGSVATIRKARGEDV